MPILETLPDPRLQALLDFTGQLQLARRQEEEERARSRERLRQRQIVAGGVALGAAGGALLGPIAASTIPAGTAAGTAVGLGPGIAPVAGGIAGSGISLASVLTGARFGAQAGGAFATDDPAGGVQAIVQGAATLSNMPELGQLGITPLQVAMAGPGGLQNLVSQAQAGRRQQENLLQQEASRQRLASDAIQALPPHARAQFATDQQLISGAILEHRRGGFGRFGSPEARQGFEQAITEPSARMEENLRSNKAPPPPTIEDEFKSKRNIWFEPESQQLISRKGMFTFSKVQSKADSGAELQASISSTALELEGLKRKQAIGQQAWRIEREGVVAEKALEEAIEWYDKTQGLLQSTHATEARVDAIREIDSRTARFRPAQGEPSQEQVQRQQEATEQQGAAAQAAGQQAEQAQAQQAQQIEQAQEFFVRSIEVLAGLQEKLGSDPAKWSREQREEARAPAEGLIVQLSILAPMMSPEQRAQILPLVKLAQALVEPERTLGGG